MKKVFNSFAEASAFAKKCALAIEAEANAQAAVDRQTQEAQNQKAREIALAEHKYRHSREFVLDRRKYYKSLPSPALEKAWIERKISGLESPEIEILKHVLQQRYEINAAIHSNLPRVCGDCLMVGDNCTCRDR